MTRWQAKVTLDTSYMEQEHSQEGEPQVKRKKARPVPPAAPAEELSDKDQPPGSTSLDEAGQVDDVDEVDEAETDTAWNQGEAEEADSAEAEGSARTEDESDQAQDDQTSDDDAPLPVDKLPDGLPVRQVVEALLFATDSPLPANKIAQILDQGTSRHVRAYIKDLNGEYERKGRAFRIEEVAGGYQMLTLPAMQPWLAKLLRARQEGRISPTQMETLAVIAYRQPVLRADVEMIRGVACADVINRLREMGLVKIVGRAEDVGRPLLYGTTRKFLRVFGLGSLDDLPRVEELKPPEPSQAPPATAAQPPTQSPEQAPPAAGPPHEPPPASGA
jgi:segregation and condensation protein B